MIDFGMGVQEAGDAARFYHTGDSQPTGQVMANGGTLELEGGVCGDVAAELAGRGHAVSRHANLGGYQAIERRRAPAPATGFVFAGASEMRKDGQAVGY